MTDHGTHDLLITVNLKIASDNTFDNIHNIVRIKQHCDY